MRRKQNRHCRQAYACSAWTVTGQPLERQGQRERQPFPTALVAPEQVVALIDYIAGFFIDWFLQAEAHRETAPATAYRR
jgi:hypothetical protein